MWASGWLGRQHRTWPRGWVHALMPCAPPVDVVRSHSHSVHGHAPLLGSQVARIVEGSREALESMYLPLLAPQQQPTAPSNTTSPSSPAPASSSSTSSQGSSNGSSSGSAVLLPGQAAGLEPGVGPQGSWVQSVSQESRFALLNHLPPALLARVSGLPPCPLFPSSCPVLLPAPPCSVLGDGSLALAVRQSRPWLLHAHHHPTASSKQQVQVAYKLGYQVPESHMEAGSATLADVAWAALRSGRHQQVSGHFVLALQDCWVVMTDGGFEGPHPHRISPALHLTPHALLPWPDSPLPTPLLSRCCSWWQRR